MVKEQEVKSAYEVAKERYAEIGVDTEKAIEQLSKVKLSIHSWQGDDIHGFLNPDQELTGVLEYLVIIQELQELLMN